MKADWIGRTHNPNNNFMRAISHPQYNAIIKKVIDCNRIKLVNQSFMDKYHKKDWSLYLNNSHYLSLDISLRIFRLLLRRQNIDITNFVNNVWNIINQKYPKKNLLIFQGVPDSGKSTIARSIVDLFQHSATVQGTASFPFMSLVNVEIGLIKEPNMTMETLQTFKKIAEGVDTEVSIKYGADQTIRRTPLIITSNHDFDQHAQYEREAFKSRYIKYRFIATSDFLSKAKKPLNPAIWNSLFEEYVLSEDTSSDSDIALSSFLDEYEKITPPPTEKRKSGAPSQPSTPEKRNRTDGRSGWTSSAVKRLRFDDDNDDDSN